MSYILDALGKAERERAAKRTPAYLVAYDFKTVRGHRLWIAAGALVLCTAAAIWFFLPSLGTVSQTPDLAATETAQDRAAGRSDAPQESESIPPSTASSGTSPAETSVPARSGLSTGAPASLEAKPQAISTPAPAPQAVSARQEGGSEKGAGDVRRPNRGTQAETLPQPSRREPETLSPSNEASPPAQPGVIPDGQAAKEATPTPPAVEGKALSLREALEKMTLSILMYSDVKAERRAYINGRKFVEGDYVEGRYLVESITLEGVVLSYEGERALLRSGPK